MNKSFITFGLFLVLIFACSAHAQTANFETKTGTIIHQSPDSLVFNEQTTAKWTTNGIVSQSVSDWQGHQLTTTKVVSNSRYYNYRHLPGWVASQSQTEAQEDVLLRFRFVSGVPATSFIVFRPAGWPYSYATERTVAKLQWDGNNLFLLPYRFSAEYEDSISSVATLGRENGVRVLVGTLCPTDEENRTPQFAFGVPDGFSDGAGGSFLVLTYGKAEVEVASTLKRVGDNK